MTSRLKESPSQTAGPYVHIGETPNFAGISGVYAEDLGVRLVSDKTNGERITIAGRVIDGAGAPVTDAVVELWQADSEGKYASDAGPGFTGWGRQPADPQTGAFRFDTIKPGRVPFGDGQAMAPHVTLWIVARGINIGLQTRVYFADEAKANAEDPVLQQVPVERRPTLVATREPGDGIPRYAFDIRLQGDNETVFFDI